MFFKRYQLTKSKFKNYLARPLAVLTIFSQLAQLIDPKRQIIFNGCFVKLSLNEFVSSMKCQE